MALPPKAVLVRLARVVVIVSVILAAVIVVPLLDAETELAELGIWPKLGVLPLATLWISSVFIAHRHKGFAVRAHDILYKTGVIRHRQTILPINRIQHIETHRNFLERQLGLSTLRLFSAGGSSADMNIRGLEEATALTIRDMVLARIQGEQEGEDE